MNSTMVQVQLTFVGKSLVDRNKSAIWIVEKVLSMLGTVFTTKFVIYFTNIMRSIFRLLLLRQSSSFPR